MSSADVKLSGFFSVPTTSGGGAHSSGDSCGSDGGLGFGANSGVAVVVAAKAVVASDGGSHSAYVGNPKWW